MVCGLEDCPPAAYASRKQAHRKICFLTERAGCSARCDDKLTRRRIAQACSRGYHRALQEEGAPASLSACIVCGAAAAEACVGSRLAHWVRVTRQDFELHSNLDHNATPLASPWWLLLKTDPAPAQLSIAQTVSRAPAAIAKVRGPRAGRGGCDGRGTEANICHHQRRSACSAGV